MAHVLSSASYRSYFSLDPGNWATDMEGGSTYGYRLLFIILISNLIAVFLQNLTIRLGTIAGLDLAAASRRYFPKWLNLFLYVLAELAIIATDLAEVIGSAIALNLLFPKLPLPAGVAITAADVLIILLFYNEDGNDPDAATQNASVRVVRYFEAFVMMLVGAVGVCFMVELAYSDIVAVDVLKGYIPTKEIFTDSGCLYVAIGIIGATVMPHNLYLHSFIIQARCHEWRSRRPRLVPLGEGWAIKQDPSTAMLDPVTKVDNEKNEQQLQTAEPIVARRQIDVDRLKTYLESSLRINLHYSFVDLLVALTFAFFVNCAILIVASANFFYGPSSQNQQVEDLFSAHALLGQYLGPPAAVVFALALLCAGQSSTLTATLAGQVIMSGFLGMTTRPWIRRIVTRLVAIIPAMVAACVAGRSGLSNMLVASQVALSIQLPFAVVPLVYFTAMKRVMKLDLVVEHKEVVATTRKTMSWFDRLFPASPSSSSSDCCRLSSLYEKLANVLNPKKPTPREHPTTNTPSTPETDLTVDLTEWPQPLHYANGWISNIVACAISLLLIGLNGYLVVALFIQL
ncbi:hypothetical protein DFQ28_001790 [Apophysomyces sp. BC1034]|nr:hypothetical protein DFQ30_011324 [Apophysomyces sp. BC1015]KAG0180098.1 hypothetical protein DFQ29_001241 [Apophysomyces sp. BC1021]KAG0190620.1 hypothetical protein DFQ28_001790 [Apophysomyces sp. BC1034]